MVDRGQSCRSDCRDLTRNAADKDETQDETKDETQETKETKETKESRGVKRSQETQETQANHGSTLMCLLPLEVRLRIRPVILHGIRTESGLDSVIIIFESRFRMCQN